MALKGILDSEYKDTLLGSFADGCLDELRQLASDLGARPYRVFWIKTRWSGGKRGRGVETVFSEEEVLPTPKVDQLSSIQLQLLDVGTDEQGALSISEISPRYSENQLRGLNDDGTAVPENETFSWEIRFSRGGPDLKRRRRFIIQGVPSYNATGLQWTVRLIRAGTDREPDGYPG